ncbi:hypothetical protein PL321_18945 [Caloramator sp. mosi_1]|uniref:MurR/RpiR family transcriptional regulator n=1 Tax=Caloramator sp. mosi_1 TaxID=3023090 RepID=UPI00235DE0DC|nr:hypothetical protein [Caloramator sp. mosi_1]WDC84259.1 hypothetical protein PL321_18945 [Caloramator sp. mosi_1]
MNNKLLKQLKVLSTNDNSTYSVIAQYLLKMYDIKNIENLKIIQIQNECHVSSSTIVRFCKHIGCSGFSELKYKLIQVKKKMI